MQDLKTNVAQFISELNAGTVEAKLSHVLSEAALGTLSTEDKKKKGKVSIEFTFEKWGEQDQVMISHKISKSIPTKRGKRTEEDTTDSLMFVGRGGVLSVNPPREDTNNQYQMQTQEMGAK